MLSKVPEPGPLHSNGAAGGAAKGPRWDSSKAGDQGSRWRQGHTSVGTAQSEGKGAGRLLAPWSTVVAVAGTTLGQPPTAPGTGLGRDGA